MNPALCHKCGLLLDGPLLSSAVICKCDGVELPPLPDAPSAAGEGPIERVHAMNCMCWKDRSPADPGTGVDTRCLSLRAAVRAMRDDAFREGVQAGYATLKEMAAKETP